MLELILKYTRITSFSSQTFLGSGVIADVDILRLKCIQFVLNASDVLATVELWGPSGIYLFILYR